MATLKEQRISDKIIFVILLAITGGSYYYFDKSGNVLAAIVAIIFGIGLVATTLGMLVGSSKGYKEEKDPIKRGGRR